MTHEQTIREYYRRIDVGDIDWVLSLFDEASEYVRADARYSSKAEIAEFYRVQRRISGRHALANLLQKGDMVVVNGSFKGVGADGSRRDVGFADFWRFNRNHKVIHRATYLAVGSHVVRD